MKLIRNLWENPFENIFKKLPFFPQSLYFLENIPQVHLGRIRAFICFQVLNVNHRIGFGCTYANVMGIFELFLKQFSQLLYLISQSMAILLNDLRVSHIFGARIFIFIIALFFNIILLLTASSSASASCTSPVPALLPIPFLSLFLATIALIHWISSLPFSPCIIRPILFWFFLHFKGRIVWALTILPILFLSLLYFFKSFSHILPQVLNGLLLCLSKNIGFFKFIFFLLWLSFRLLCLFGLLVSSFILPKILIRVISFHWIIIAIIMTIN